MAARRVIWLAMLAVAAAHAEPSAELRARRQFEAAVAAQEGGRFEEALRAFRAAWELAPYAGIRLRMAECEEALGRTADAIADYQRYLDEAPRSSKREMVEARLKRLQTAGTPQPVESDAQRSEAQRRFEIGSGHYAAGDYAGALREFLEAQKQAPSAALDFNIARCQDRLGHTVEAVTGYERYLDAEPFAEDAATVRQRVAELKQRLAPPPVPSAAPATVLTAAPPPRRTVRPFIPAIAVGSSAVALAVIGMGLKLSVTDDDYNRLLAMRPVSEAQIAPYRDRELAGVVLLGIAGALVIADVALLVVAARRRR